MGNTKVNSMIYTSTLGSPPHTWGILMNSLMVDYKVRITPTYMGNTAPLKYKHVGLMGSPPHTWGIPTVDHAIVNDVGITPTYMGNTKRSLTNQAFDLSIPQFLFSLLI